MQYYSTNGKSPPVSLKEAVLGSLAPDGGLYMPCSLPRLPSSYFDTIRNLSLKEIGFDLATAFLGDDIPGNVLSDIIDGSLNFPVPLERIEADVYSLELFHGPTMAFKDIGARFMSRLMSYLHRDEMRHLNVIVATSGDTGSAVAAGFYNVPGIRVFVLFPKARISRLQQKQITTWGGNIHAIEVDGSFDDCQRLARLMLGDRQLNDSLLLTSANSINIARLIPQSIYYFHAFAQLDNNSKPVVFSVPSGNFGNLTGGLMAGAAGLPVDRFVAATNINDVFPRFMETGRYVPAIPEQTVSSAMDVGDPSNFVRIEELMGSSMKNFHDRIVSYPFTDRQTLKAVKDVYRRTGYVMDPHGAVAYCGLERYMSAMNNNVNGIFLETAHPAKFPEIITGIIEGYDDNPPQLQGVMESREYFIRAGNDPEQLKDYIMELNS